MFLSIVIVTLFRIPALSPQLMERYLIEEGISEIEASSIAYPATYWFDQE